MQAGIHNTHNLQNEARSLSLAYARVPDPRKITSIALQ
jgi:hypothetical protein